MKSAVAEETDRKRHWNTILHEKDLDFSSISSGSIPNLQSKESKTCPICRQDFSGVSNLNKHINGVHRKIKPFKCQKCEARFQYKSGLVSHENSVHLRIKPHRCWHCGKLFSDKSNMNKHASNLHRFRRPKSTGNEKNTSQD